jgi:hypothetical protein
MKAAVRPGLLRGLTWHSCLPAHTRVGYVSREIVDEARQGHEEQTIYVCIVPFVKEYGLSPRELCDCLLSTFRSAALTTPMSLLATHEMHFKPKKVLVDVGGLL